MARIEVGEFAPLARREARRRFIEEEQRRVRGEGAGDGDAPLLPEGQALRRDIRDARHADARQQLPGFVARRRFLSPVARQPERRLPETVTAARVAADHHILQHRHLREEPDILEGDGDTEPCPLVGQQIGDLPPTEGHPPRIWSVLPGNRLEER